VSLRPGRTTGTETDECGNGICAAAQLVHEWGLARAPILMLETVHGILPAVLELKDNRVERIRIDVGKPLLRAEQIPTRLPGNPPVEVPITFPDRMHNVTCIGMLGGPHCAVFVRELSDAVSRGEFRGCYLPDGSRSMVCSWSEEARYAR
jgi:diaminopimelate epimerase